MAQVLNLARRRVPPLVALAWPSFGPPIRLNHTHALKEEVLDQWIASRKHLLLRDSLSLERVADLFCTLPTRDGTRAPSDPIQPRAPLPYGAHLAFFHPRTPERLLRADGTDADFCPPAPFTRRMWAGGRMEWDNDSPLRSHMGAQANCAIVSVDKKGFDVKDGEPRKSPMVFVTQRIEVTMANKSMHGPSLIEERSHVYLSETASSTNKAPKEGESFSAGYPRKN